MLDELEVNCRVPRQLRDPFAAFNTFYNEADEGGPADNDAAAAQSDAQASENESEGFGQEGADTSHGDGTDGPDRSAFGTKRQIGDNTPMGQEKGDVDTQDGIDNANDFGFGLNQQAADMGFEDATKEVTTVNPISGLIGYKDTFLGFDIDKHAWGNIDALSAKSFGFGDEAAADALEVLGISVTHANISAAKAVAEVAIGVLFGAPAVSVAISAINAVNEVGYASGQISKETHDEIALGVAFAGLAVAGVAGVKGIAAGANAIDAGYTGLGIAAIGMSAYGVASAIGRVGRAADAAGYSSDDVSAADIGNSFGENGGDYSGDATSVINAIADHIRDYSDSTLVGALALDAVANSSATFDYMAGGKYYNVKMAGSKMWHPDNDGMEVDAERHSLLLGKGVAASVLQTDMLEYSNNVMPLKEDRVRGNDSYAAVLKSIELEALYAVTQQ